MRGEQGAEELGRNEIGIPKVNAPANQLIDIRLLMSLAPRVASTGHLACVAIQTKLQAHAMDLIDDGLDAVGPFGGVRDQLSVTITGFGRPAVVDVDVWIQ
jgi:hypothetical protein